MRFWEQADNEAKMREFLIDIHFDRHEELLDGGKPKREGKAKKCRKTEHISTCSQE